MKATSWTLLPLLLLGACTADPDRSAGTGTDVTASGGTGTGTTGGTGGTTDGGFTTAVVPDAIGDETTTDTPQDVSPACEALCVKELACGLTPSFASCAEQCSAEYPSDSTSCADAVATFLDCMADLGCDDLPHGASGPCSEDRAKMQQACGDNEACGTIWGGSPDMCDFQLLCDDAPVHRMACDRESCSCLIGIALKRTCPAETICTDLDALAQKARDCCGF